MLPKHLQKILKTLLPHCARVVLQGRNPYDSLEREKNYVFHLYDQLAPYTRAEYLLYRYNDRVQSPLQPLMNNLGASHYELFETDTGKYAQYEKALALAFTHFRLHGRFFPDSQPPVAVPADVIMESEHEISILVVGAGRGPLVKAAFAAAKKTGSKIRVVAMEKNPNAIVALANLKWTEEWGNALEVIRSDIREWDTRERFEIVLSELLGSFGDNELCPECLDGAQRLIKQPGGVFIPYKYASYLRPCEAEKVWTQAKAEGECEVPQVVRLHSAAYLGSPQRVFEFSHPRPAPEQPNNCYARVLFSPTARLSVVHGLAGYFDGTLYQDIHTGNLPSECEVTQRSPEMHTWFPMFLPLVSPVLVAAGEKVEAQVWRCVDSTHVWYEWAIQTESGSEGSCRTALIHNLGGKAYSMGLH